MSRQFTPAQKIAMREARERWLAIPGNKERAAAHRAAYAKRNPHKFASANKARKLATRTPSWADLDAIKAIYADSAALTLATGVSHEVDHVVPVRGRNVCGLHVENNLQVLTASDNRRKWNTFDN